MDGIIASTARYTRQHQLLKQNTITLSASIWRGPLRATLPSQPLPVLTTVQCRHCCCIVEVPLLQSAKRLLQHLQNTCLTDI